MKLKRLAASAVTSFTAIVGLNVVAVGPAQASPYGTWRPYRTSPINVGWRCGATSTITTGVFAQACVIRSTAVTNRVQAAVIVQNRRSTGYSTWADASLMEDNVERSGIGEGTWRCSSSGLAANSYSVCFGETEIFADFALAGGTVHNVILGYSPST
jgi:hypothetical protein